MEGATLPVIKSAATQRFIDANYGNEFLWLSARDLAGGDEWQWEYADGETECMSGYTNWKDGEPSDDSERCAITEQGKGWSDVTCYGRKFEFLCQILHETFSKGTSKFLLLLKVIDNSLAK